MSDILNTILQQKLIDRYTPKTNNNVGGMRGLLNMVNSPRGQDIATGLLAQSGYSPTPVNLGSAIGQANQYATENQFKRDANELADISALSTMVSDKNKSNKLSEFQENMAMFNKIDSIPQGERSKEEQNNYIILAKKLSFNDTLKELVDEIGRKTANNKNYVVNDDEKAVISLYQKLNIVGELLMPQGNSMETLNTKKNIKPKDQTNNFKIGDTITYNGEEYVYKGKGNGEGQWELVE
jgi:hypothetical protein